MSSDLPGLFQKLLNTYQSDGLSHLLQSIYRRAVKKLRRTALRGEWQFYFLSTIRFQFQKVKFNAPANHFRPIWVDPKCINYNISKFSWEWGLGQIHGGNWDDPDDSNLIENSPRYIGLKQRFEEGIAWENTEYFTHIKKKFHQLEDGESLEGYDNIKQFRDVRLKFIDELYQKIRDKGYRPNFVAKHEAPDVDKRSSTTWYHSRYEPLVSIGRNGRIYLFDGFHRVTISKLLGIESIPVNVIVRHRLWQKIRDEVYEMDEVSRSRLGQISTHPDLIDIVSSADCGDLGYSYSDNERSPDWD